jgi:ribosomal protein L34E
MTITGAKMRVCDRCGSTEVVTTWENKRTGDERDFCAQCDTLFLQMPQKMPVEFESVNELKKYVEEKTPKKPGRPKKGGK